jgi:glycerol-3-phosphate acyltransferase PlsX
MVKIAVDGMGGDFAPLEIVEGLKLAVNEIEDLEILLTGREEELKRNCPCR